MRVDICSDIVCPWCYIGERRFARGPAGFEHRDEVEVGELVDVAAEAGLDRGRAQQALEDGSYGDAVRADEDEARALGIAGVPFYVVDGKYGISGAQPAEAFTQTMQQVWAC